MSQGSSYPPAPRTDSGATAAMITAIVGFILCPPVAGVVALILALNAERRIKESGGRLTGLDQTRIAKVVAIIELALTLFVAFLLVLLVAFASHTSSPPRLT